MAKQQTTNNTKGGASGSGKQQKSKVASQTAVEPKKKKTRESLPFIANSSEALMSQTISSDLFALGPSIGIFGQNGGDHQIVQTKPDADYLKRESTPTPNKLSLAGIPSTPLVIQTKMRVTAANDIYEKEADRVADQVVQRINTTSVQLKREELDSLSSSRSSGAIEISRYVQRRAIGFEGGNVSGDFESTLNRARPSGRKLGSDLQQKMEGAFGADFSGVRIHTGGQADTLNRMINAKAFTTGKDIFFSKGNYSPASREGQHLLAHELTHVVQQNGPAVQRKWQTPLTPTIQMVQAQGSVVQRVYDVSAFEIREDDDSEYTYDVDAISEYEEDDSGPTGDEAVEQNKNKLIRALKSVWSGTQSYLESNTRDTVAGPTGIWQTPSTVLDTAHSSQDLLQNGVHGSENFSSFQGDLSSEKFGGLNDFGKSQDTMGSLWEIGTGVKRTATGAHDLYNAYRGGDEFARYKATKGLKANSKRFVKGSIETLADTFAAAGQLQKEEKIVNSLAKMLAKGLSKISDSGTMEVLGTIGGILGPVVSGFYLTDQIRKGIYAHKRYRKLKLVALANSSENGELLEYAKKKNKRLRRRAMIGGIAASLSLVGGVLGLTPLAPIGAVLSGVGSMIGLAMGADKLKGWATKKYKDVKKLRAVQGKDVGGLTGRIKTFGSAMTTGKSKIVSKIQQHNEETSDLSQMITSDSNERREVAMSILKLATRWYAYMNGSEQIDSYQNEINEDGVNILEALNLKPAVMNKIESLATEDFQLKGWNPDTLNDIVTDIMSKIRSQVN